MTKKILLFLILLFALPLTQLQAQTYTHFANGKTWSYTVSGGKATITGASPATGELNIPDTVGTAPKYEVTAIGDGAFQYNPNITKLTANSVTTIGNTVFINCTGLTGKLELPKVTTIGYSAFPRCSGLTSLEIPNVTTIGYSAFGSCTGLTGKLELPSVTTIGDYAFEYCSGLTGKLEIPNVTTIGEYAFYRCAGLTGKLELPKVTTIGNGAFSNCTGLTGKLELPSVTTIGSGAFSFCSGLTGKLELPKTLTSIGSGAFEGCIGLTAVTFENGTNLTSVTGYSHFRNCNNLQYIDMSGVTFPSTFTTVNRSESVFRGTQPYTIVYLPVSAPIASGWSWYSVNFVRGNTCDKFVVYDMSYAYKSGNVGCNYPIQHEFTANTAEYQDRNFTGTTCKTICLPYPATLPDGMRAYTLTKKNTVKHESFIFTAISGNQLAANTPYLLRITDGSSYSNNNFASNNVLVPVTPTTIETQAADGSGFYFGGTTTNIDNATAASNNYYNLSNDKWYPIKTSDTNGYVHSFRAYIRTTGGTPAKGFAMVIDDDENATTDIDNVAELTEDELRSGKHTFYTLDGRRAGTNYDTLKSGEMYVVKGQKFYKF